MRSNFFKKLKLSRLIKVADRVMLVVFIVFWGMIAFFLSKTYIEKKYIYPLNYSDTVATLAKEYQLDDALIFATIKVESGFNGKAVSSVGAVGLMQIMPSTADYIAKLLGEGEYDLFNEQTNLKYGCYYLKYLFNRFGELDTVICAYNAGEGNVESWLKNKEYSKDGIKLVKIPFKETEDYKRKISKSYKKYKQLYENILDK